MTPQEIVAQQSREWRVRQSKVVIEAFHGAMDESEALVRIMAFDASLYDSLILNAGDAAPDVHHFFGNSTDATTYCERNIPNNGELDGDKFAAKELRFAFGPRCSDRDVRTVLEGGCQIWLGLRTYGQYSLMTMQRRESEFGLQLIQPFDFPILRRLSVDLFIPPMTAQQNFKLTCEFRGICAQSPC